MARWHSDTTDIAVIMLSTHYKIFYDWIIMGIFKYIVEHVLRTK